VEAPKNQLMLVAALRASGLKLVLIGSARLPQYLELVRAYGPADLVVLPHLKPDEVASAYAAARVHALPSWMETCGMVTMEAALADCNAVCSIAGYEMEYYRDLVYYCDPADVGSIRSAVESAHANYEGDGPRRVALKQRLLSEYTWQRAAELTYRAYREVLSKHQEKR
jgi:glycosyltransferase involved in cell wall biosynthesis